VKFLYRFGTSWTATLLGLTLSPLPVPLVAQNGAPQARHSDVSCTDESDRRLCTGTAYTLRKALTSASPEAAHVPGEATRTIDIGIKNATPEAARALREFARPIEFAVLAAVAVFAGLIRGVLRRGRRR